MPKPVTTPHVSPYVYESADYIGLRLRIEIEYNNQTRAIQGATVLREQRIVEGEVTDTCVYSRILLGLGPDGTPDSSTQVFEVPPGTTQVSKQYMASIGLNVIEDVWAKQITGGFPQA